MAKNKNKEKPKQVKEQNTGAQNTTFVDDNAKNNQKAPGAKKDSAGKDAYS